MNLLKTILISLLIFISSFSFALSKEFSFFEKTSLNFYCFFSKACDTEKVNNNQTTRE